MKRRKREVTAVELYFDSTVDPFANPPFRADRVMEMLRMLESLGIKVKLVDTAGWSRDMLIEQYKLVAGRRRNVDDIFGPRGRRGWFFGREVPALVVYWKHGKTGIYPCYADDKLITPSDFLKELLEQRGEEK